MKNLKVFSRLQVIIGCVPDMRDVISHEPPSSQDPILGDSDGPLSRDEMHLRSEIEGNTGSIRSRATLAFTICAPAFFAA
jgi:hypothetical protein